MPVLQDLSLFHELKFLNVNGYSLTNSSFDSLIHLRRLILDKCDFKCMDNAFKNISNSLEFLEITQPQNWQHLDFTGLTQLKWLQINEVRFVSCPFNSLNPGLEAFTFLASCTIFSFELLDSFTHANLKLLDLNLSNIFCYNTDSLCTLPNLNTFRLNSTIDQFTIGQEVLSNLENLYLTSSSLESIDGQLSSFPNLKTLDLRKCSLKPNSKIFAGLNKLERLNLSCNERFMKGATNEMFKGLENLTELDLTFTGASYAFDPDMFKHVPNLSKLNLSRNKLTLSTNTFRHLTNLKELNLWFAVKNHGSLDQGIFSLLKNLEILILCDNEIAKISRNMLNGLVSLRLLDVSLNHLTKIAPNAFHDLTKLKLIKLSSKKLKKDLEKSFGNRVKVERVY